MTTLLNSKRQVLAKNIVLIDGFSSSGKSLIGPILGYLKRCEQWQLNNWFDYISTLHYLKKISQSSVTAFTKIRADELIYNLFLGRNVNFRTTDHSSPYFDGLQKKYLKRLKEKEGKYAINKIIRSEPILPLAVHYLYGNSKILLKAFENRLKLYIVCLRDPFVLIQKWHDGNWPKKIEKDPRFFEFCLNYKDTIIPWYAKKYAVKYRKANGIEKSILTVYHLYKGVFSMYEKKSDKEKKKLLIIFFEDFIQFPNLYIDKICKTLKTEREKNFKKIMKKNFLPRKIISQPITTIKDFVNKYSKNFSPVYNKMIIELNELYLEFYSLHKISKNKN